MALERDFADILQEKLGTPPKRETMAAPLSPSAPQFPHWKYRIESPIRTFTPAKIPNIYPKKSPRIRVKKAINPPKPKVQNQEKTFKIGELGLDLATPLNTLQSLGAHLDPEKISLSGLKKEYRKLARKYHPDSNPSTGSAKFFHEACKAYGLIRDSIEAKNKK